MPTNAALPTVAELGCVPLLSGCDPRRLAQLAQSLRLRFFTKGETVLAHGEPGQDLYLLLSGQLLANRYSIDGQEVGYRRLVAPTHFGELAALDGGQRSINVTAATDARVATMSQADFVALLEAEPGLARQLLIELAGRVRELSDRLFEAGTVDTRGRVAAQIVRIAVAAGATEDGVELFPAPTHAELAAMVGGTRETVTRSLSQLADAGVLVKEGRRIVIRQFDALTALSGG
jgi:CRP/FNR family transcriptional regulator, cyclic AMP receptor protein